jgi:hypothetical protein
MGTGLSLMMTRVLAHRETGEKLSSTYRTTLMSKISRHAHQLPIELQALADIIGMSSNTCQQIETILL